MECSEIEFLVLGVNLSYPILMPDGHFLIEKPLYPQHAHLLRDLVRRHKVHMLVIIGVQRSLNVLQSSLRLKVGLVVLCCHLGQGGT